MTIGEKVTQLRRDMSLTQKELSEKLSIGHSTLSCYETNARQIPYDTLIALAKFFDVTTDYLLGLED
ncbi:MAG: helix-turn-helix domain-containing protein [Firmicutes bacterium]|nr:helix-turn-helix domain-containing protein [Bacillota bacterium]